MYIRRNKHSKIKITSIKLADTDGFFLSLSLSFSLSLSLSLYIYIYIYISFYLSITFTIHPHFSSLLVGLLNCIQCPYRADVCKSLLIGPL